MHEWDGTGGAAGHELATGGRPDWDADDPLEALAQPPPVAVAAKRDKKGATTSTLSRGASNHRYAVDDDDNDHNDDDDDDDDDRDAFYVSRGTVACDCRNHNEVSGDGVGGDEDVSDDKIGCAGSIRVAALIRATLFRRSRERPSASEVLALIEASVKTTSDDTEDGSDAVSRRLRRRRVE